MSRYRIPPSKKIRKEIRAMAEGITSEGKFEGNPIEKLMEKAKLLIVEELLEKEVEEFLERPYYQRKKAEGELKGYRNGYEPRKLKTAEGALTWRFRRYVTARNRSVRRYRSFLRIIRMCLKNCPRRCMPEV